MVHIKPPATYTRVESAGLLALASRNAINPGDWPEPGSFDWLDVRLFVRAEQPEQPEQDRPNLSGQCPIIKAIGPSFGAHCFCDRCLADSLILGTFGWKP